MLKKYLFKLKRAYYYLVLGILQVFAFSFFLGCSNSPDKKKDNTADSIARVKRINDSLAKEKHHQDSLTGIKKIQDSIIREDSITKAKQIKIKYKPVIHAPKYGIPNVKH
jgi:hypothetical protein